MLVFIPTFNAFVYLVLMFFGNKAKLSVTQQHDA